MISQSRLHELFDYQDGHLIRKVRTSSRVKIGDKCGTPSSNGYIGVHIDGERHLLHRLIFCWHHGYFPQFVDHIDRNRSNNRIENLRSATASQNQGNRNLDSKNTSGYRGVTWHKAAKKWQARIKTNGKVRHLGLFLTAEDAYMAYCKEAKQYFGEFANV